MIRARVWRVSDMIGPRGCLRTQIDIKTWNAPAKEWIGRWDLRRDAACSCFLVQTKKRAPGIVRRQLALARDVAPDPAMSPLANPRPLFHMLRDLEIKLRADVFMRTGNDQNVPSGGGGPDQMPSTKLDPIDRKNSRRTAGRRSNDQRRTCPPRRHLRAAPACAACARWRRPGISAATTPRWDPRLLGFEVQVFAHGRPLEPGRGGPRRLRGALSRLAARARVPQCSTVRSTSS